MKLDRIEYYLRQRWTRETDCFYWFRAIQAAEYGREILPLHLGNGSDASLVHGAMRAMAGDIAGRLGWAPTETPVDGDAVFMGQKLRPHHIGTVVDVQGRPLVLHALKGCGNAFV